MIDSITPGTHLAGIRYWAQWKPIGYKPRFDVYEFIGSYPDIGSYVFKLKKDNTVIISKAFGQLNTNGFIPFCYDTKKILEAHEAIGNK